MNMILFGVGAYLLGSIPFALVTSKIFGLEDPRTYGSGNPGATNVLRSGHKLAALLTLLGDAAKGWLAVWLAQCYQTEFSLGEKGIALAAICVFVGHLWPIFARFAGGKGVATALGVLLGFSPLLALIVLVTWLCVAFLTRYSSLAALLAALTAPLYDWLLYGLNHQFVAVCAMSALLVYRHKSNIVNLLTGKESKIGQKKKS